MISDPWEGPLQDWLHTAQMKLGIPADCEYLQIDDIMRGVMGESVRNFKSFDMHRIGKIMRKFGYEKRQKRFGNIRMKVWCKV
jgi:hypothetical protein